MRTIVTITGPSLSGKSTLAGNLQSRDERLRELISTTTRPPRGYERHGQHYYFVSQEEFDRTPMVEATEHSGNKYGLSVSETERVFLIGGTPIIVVDPFGAEQIANYATAQGLRHLSIFVATPRRTRFERLLRRFRDDAAATEGGYADRLEFMLGHEEGWRTQREWHATVSNYDLQTEAAIDAGLLEWIFRAD
jgi:guanylate kinase